MLVLGLGLECQILGLGLEAQILGLGLDRAASPCKIVICQSLNAIFFIASLCLFTLHSFRYYLLQPTSVLEMQRECCLNIVASESHPGTTYYDWRNIINTLIMI